MIPTETMAIVITTERIMRALLSIISLPANNLV